MIMPIAFLRSLLLASAISFATPILLIASLLFSLFIVSQVPIMQTIACAIAAQVLNVLSVFGSGSSVEGALVIGLTCSLVGALFDTYAFYRHQILHDS
jgi:hypothetical protein